MRRFNKKTGGKRFGRREKTNYLQFDQKEFPGSLPTKETKSNSSFNYEYKAFRGLQNVGSIEVKADPNTTVAKGGYPYRIIAQTNKVVDANYAGIENIDGNVLTRLQNSNSSKLLNTYDCLTINQRLNYLFACYKLDNSTYHNNMAVNIELTKTMNEALAKGYSTMLTQLPFYTDEMWTDMPVMNTWDDAFKQTYYKLGLLLHYQTVLQNTVAPLSKYIQTMSLEQEIMDMSYRREATILTALFGMFKKKAFVATLNAIGTTLMTEHFDKNWYMQTNTLAFMASRKSKAMTDPLITSSMTTCIPHAKMFLSGEETPYYDSDEVLSVKGVFINPDTFQYEGTAQEPITLTYEQLIYRLVRMLDVTTILTWARQANMKTLPATALQNPSAYYEAINKLINAVNVTAAAFATNMSEVRTFIEKLNESGLVYWTKNNVVRVDDIKVIDADYNIILADLVAGYLGGASEMSYDEKTQRWQASTLWNKYTGIARFDKMSGGSFLTFGLRHISASIPSDDVAMCIPVAFSPELTPGSTACLATNRLGERVTVDRVEEANINTNRTLARLDPLKIGFKVRVPRITFTGLTGEALATRSSAALALFSSIVGYGSIKSGSVTETTCDPDYLAFIDVQIDDVSNEMIQFCRNYCPFRVSTPDGRRPIGFGGTTKTKAIE